MSCAGRCAGSVPRYEGRFNPKAVGNGKTFSCRSIDRSSCIDSSSSPVRPRIKPVWNTRAGRRPMRFRARNADAQYGASRPKNRTAEYAVLKSSRAVLGDEEPPFPAHHAPRLYLLQRHDDLRLRVPASAHLPFPFPSFKSYFEMDGFRGSGQSYCVLARRRLRHGGGTVAPRETPLTRNISPSRLLKKGEAETNCATKHCTGAEARASFAALSARLKSCPVTKPRRGEFFRSLLGPPVMKLKTKA